MSPFVFIVFLGGIPLAYLLLLRRGRYIGAGVSIAVIIAFAAGQNLPTYYRLAVKGATANGVVTKTSCNQHTSFSYQFSVDATSHNGVGSEGFGNPGCAALKPGDTVLVSYLPQDPRVNVPGDSAARFKNEIISVAAAGIFIPLFVVWAYRRRAED